MPKHRIVFFSFTLRWLVLALAGWMGYALARALWAVICLGAPIYDWLWYVPVTIPLVGLPLHFALRLPRNRWAFLVLSSALIFALAGYNGLGQVIHLRPGNAPVVPISFWAFSDFRLATPDLLRDLQASGGRIYFHYGNYPVSQEQNQALIERLRPLDEYKIEVYVVPPAPEFLSVLAYREWSESTLALADLVERAGLTQVRGLIGDVEPPLNKPMDIWGTQRASFDQAAVGLRDLIDVMHREHPNLRIGVTATGAHYLDRLDGDPDLAVVMRSPLDPPGGWDFLNMMTYSSYYPPDWRAYSVYLAERGAARLYPHGQVSHLIGLVGGGLPWEPLLDFDDLVRDARLSRALGVSEIVVFQLDGALKQFGPDFVRRFTVAVNAPQPDVTVPFSRPASALVYGAAAADALLNARGSWGWLWLVWAAVCSLIVRARRRA